MKHILIVDDSAVVRKVARRIMESLALRVSEAEDGKEALAACEAAMPDALLLDCGLPGMDGCEVLKALRRLPDGNLPKVLFCTSENHVALIARAMYAGANDYVMKPFDREMMVEKLQDLEIVRPAETAA